MPEIVSQRMLTVALPTEVPVLLDWNLSTVKLCSASQWQCEQTPAFWTGALEEKFFKVS